MFLSDLILNTKSRRVFKYWVVLVLIKPITDGAGVPKLKRKISKHYRAINLYTLDLVLS